MPFYEGIGLMGEKNAVCFDFGAVYAKVGYAGEAAPRAIIKTPAQIADPKASADVLYAVLVDFIHKIYFQHLLVNPKDRRVVLVDHILGPIRLKEALSKVLFKHFEALSVLYAPSPLLPLLTLGVESGLYVDVGFKEALVVPVFEGVPILKAWQGQPLASETVHEELRRLLNAHGTVKIGNGDVRPLSEVAVTLSEDAVEDIKVRLCFVTNAERGRQIQRIKRDASQVSGLSSFLKKSVPSSTYYLSGNGSGNTQLFVDGGVRESAFEVLFERDEDGISLPSMLLDALKASPIDARRDLAANVVLVGGTSAVLGFKARLFEELKLLLADEYKDKLPASLEFKLHKPPTKENFTCWAGASLFGATDAIGTRSYARETYMKENAVPDWSDFRFNSLMEDSDGVDKQG